MAQINIRVDDDLKLRAEALFRDFGLSMSAAVNIFFRQALKTGKFPFEITATGSDSFWGEANQAHLRKVFEDLKAGKNLVTKTMEELEAMEQ